MMKKVPEAGAAAVQIQDLIEGTASQGVRRTQSPSRRKRVARRRSSFSGDENRSPSRVADVSGAGTGSREFFQGDQEHTSFQEVWEQEQKSVDIGRERYS